MTFVTFTEAGNALVTVMEVWGRGLAAGASQWRAWPLSCLESLQSLQNMYKVSKGSPLQPLEWCEYLTEVL